MNIRPAADADAQTLARLHIEGWKAAYGGLVDQSHLDSLSLDKRTQDWGGWLASGESDVFLAEEGGQAAGFVSCGKLRTAPPGTSSIRPLYSGEIYALYLLPEHWRKGIGRALLAEAAGALKARKHGSACLWVLDGNARAKSFYEALGGQRAGKKMVEIGPSSLKEICYGWRDLGSLLKK